MQGTRFQASAEEQSLHERLLAGDATAPAELVERYLAPVTRRLLGSRSPGPDTHLVEDAAIEALLSYVKRPAQYQPERRGLGAYLLMSAGGDLKNARAREGRYLHHSAEFDEPTTVEVSLRAGKSPVEDEVFAGLELELPQGLSPEEALHLVELEFPDEVDRRVLRLMLDGVRETAAYAGVLDIEGLSLVEQQRRVKRDKDRLGKRLERLRAKMRSGEEAR